MVVATNKSMYVKHKEVYLHFGSIMKLQPLRGCQLSIGGPYVTQDAFVFTLIQTSGHMCLKPHQTEV